MKYIKNIKQTKIIIADLQCLFAAFLFGIGFLGQREISVEGLGPMTCNAFRFGLSTIFILMFLPLFPGDSSTEKTSDNEEEEEGDEREKCDGSNAHNDIEARSVKPEKESRIKSETSSHVILRLLGPSSLSLKFTKKNIWFWGIALGWLNFLGSGFQQWGITKTSASKVAFIAGFDLFLTPIFGLFIPTFKLNAEPQLSTWLAVCLSLVGLFLLSGASYEDFEMGMGETLTLISTIFWTLHITYTDIATTHVDTMPMMCVQLGCVTFLSACTALWFEPREWLWAHMYGYWPWLLFLSIVDGLGFTLMAAGQNYAPPTHAAIILSLEGVFAAISSYLLLGEHLSIRETTGCIIMLISTLAAEIGCPAIDQATWISTRNTDPHQSTSPNLHFSHIESGDDLKDAFMDDNSKIKGKGKPTGFISQITFIVKSTFAVYNGWRQSAWTYIFQARNRLFKIKVSPSSPPPHSSNNTELTPEDWRPDGQDFSLRN